MSTRHEIEMLRTLLHDGEVETPESLVNSALQETTRLHDEDYSQEEEKQSNWSGDPAETPRSLQGYSYGAIFRMWLDGELSAEEVRWLALKNVPARDGQSMMPNLKLIELRRGTKNGKAQVSD